MTQQGRARIAFKVLGIVFLVEVGETLPMAWDMLRTALADHGQQAGGMGIVAFGGMLALFAAVGVGCLVWARGLARGLLPPLEPEPPWPFEFLRGGVCLIGVWLLLMGAGASLGLVSSWERTVVPAIAIFLCLGVTFVRVPERIAATLGRCARGGLSSTAEAGAVLILLYAACRALARAVGSAAIWRQLVGQPGFAAPLQHIARIVGEPTARFVVAAGMVLFAGALCRRYGRDREDSGQSKAAVRFSPHTAMVAALAVSVCYLLVTSLSSWEGPWNYHDVKWGSVWEIARAIVISVIAVIVVLWVSSYVVWPLGRFLSGGGAPAQEAETSPVLLAVEVALALLAIHGFRRVVGDALSDLARSGSPQAEGGYVRACLAVVFMSAGYAALLAFKGDLGWLCRPRRTATQEASASVRAGVVQPWVFLLGLWFAAKGIAALASWAVAGCLSGMWDPTWAGSAWETALGVALIVGARWLSVRLSSGRLIPAIWKWVDYGGG